MALSIESRTSVDQKPVVIDGFEVMAQALGVSSQIFTGNVLVACPGPNFFEQKLLGSQNSLTVVDLHSDPRDRGQKGVTELQPGEWPNLIPGAVNYYQWSLQSALSGVGLPIFDAATFFRVEDMQSQFPDILATVGRTLKPGRPFIGSGGFMEETSFLGMIDDQFLVESTAVFSNPDYSGKGYQGKHIGFVLRRR